MSLIEKFKQQEAKEKEAILEQERKKKDFDAFDALGKLGKEMKRVRKRIPPPMYTYQEILRLKKIEPKTIIKYDEGSWRNLGYEIYYYDPKQTGNVIQKVAYVLQNGDLVERINQAPQIKFRGVQHNPLHQNPNAIFIGGTGSAKTVRAKREVENRYLEGRRIFVIDPKGEWEHGLCLPQETEREIDILKWNGEYPRSFPVRIIPPRFDDRVALHHPDILADVASVRTDNQRAQVAILLNTFKEEMKKEGKFDLRIGDFINFATVYVDEEKDIGKILGEGEEGKKKKKVSIPHIKRGLAKLKERYDSHFFAPVLEEMINMPQREIGVVSAGTVFKTEMYGLLLEHWTKLFFNYLMTNTCPKCYETYNNADIRKGIRECVQCGGHYDSAICKKCGCREFQRREPDGKCLYCGTEISTVISTDIVLEECQEGTSKTPRLATEIARIMSINRVMGGGCGLIIVTQSAKVLDTGGGGMNPIFTNVGMCSFAGSISGRKDKGTLRDGFEIPCGTMNTDEDKLQIIRYSDTRLGLKVCDILPPRSYHPMYSGFDDTRLNV
jgi:hypothetical protein